MQTKILISIIISLIVLLCCCSCCLFSTFTSNAAFKTNISESYSYDKTIWQGNYYAELYQKKDSDRLFDPQYYSYIKCFDINHSQTGEYYPTNLDNQRFALDSNSNLASSFDIENCKAIINQSILNYQNSLVSEPAQMTNEETVKLISDKYPDFKNLDMNQALVKEIISRVSWTNPYFEFDIFNTKDNLDSNKTYLAVGYIQSIISSYMPLARQGYDCYQIENLGGKLEIKKIEQLNDIQIEQLPLELMSHQTVKLENYLDPKTCKLK